MTMGNPWWGGNPQMGMGPMGGPGMGMVPVGGPGMGMGPMGGPGMGYGMGMMGPMGPMGPMGQMGPMGMGFGGPCPGYAGPMYGQGPTWGGTWAPGAWGGAWGPAYGGFGGLGGLRTWGGSYSPQFTTTGIPTDEEIEEMVYDAMDNDPVIPYEADVEVDSDAGTVTLTGTVPSKLVKHAAGEDAWWIPGVIDVHNNLAVSGQHKGRRGESEQQPAQRQRQTGGARR